MKDDVRSRDGVPMRPASRNESEPRENVPNLKSITIKENDDFSDIELINAANKRQPSLYADEPGFKYGYDDDPRITVLSDNEIGYEIWSFKITGAVPSLSGMYHDGILKVLNQLGVYRKMRDNSTSYIYVRELDNILEEIDTANIKKLIKDYISRMDVTVHFSHRGLQVHIQRDKLMETYLRFAPQKVEDKFLQLLPLHTKPLLADTNSASYFLFKNCIQKVTADSIESVSYESLKNTCIWKDHIVKRSFTYSDEGDKSQFSHFIHNVTNKDAAKFTAFRSAIGYLLNNYSSPSQTQAIIAYDEEITDLKNPMGGTGKGIKAKSIAQLRKVVKIDGKKFNPKDRFKFQDVDTTAQVVWLDDISPEVGFDTFHSCLTDGWSIEKKYQDSYLIPPEKSPKLLITSNTILQGSGTTNKRRQFVLEFSNHYSSKIRNGNEKPIEDEHGGLFFDAKDWDTAEWTRFYSFMLDCCQYYHEEGLVAYKHKSVHLNLLRQSTSEEFYNWVSSQSFVANQPYETAIYYSDYLQEAGFTRDQFSGRKFADFLKSYAVSCDLKHVSYRSNSKQYFKFTQLTP